MHMQGVLRGLTHRYDRPINYFVHLGDEQITLNDYIGEKIRLTFQGQIECIHCGRKIKKTYNNGYCFPCFKRLPENDLCMVKPHLCHFNEGTCRDEQFGKTQCMVPHYVYLALSSDIKVGITRKNRELKRWVDQGALKAVPIAEVPSRKTAGELEAFLAKYVPDKTNWRKMLKGPVTDKSLQAVREEMVDIIPETFRPFLLTNEELIDFTYPILEELDQIKAYNLHKTPMIQDRLIGIKGQYLLFDAGVINMKKYAGYHIGIQVG